jgi:hypothetical protein
LPRGLLPGSAGAAANVGRLGGSRAEGSLVGEVPAVTAVCPSTLPRRRLARELTGNGGGAAAGEDDGPGAGA